MKHDLVGYFARCCISAKIIKDDDNIIHRQETPARSCQGRLMSFGWKREAVYARASEPPVALPSAHYGPISGVLGHLDHPIEGLEPPPPPPPSHRAHSHYNNDGRERDGPVAGEGLIAGGRQLLPSTTGVGACSY